jgi:hypothetical protein
MKRLLITLAAGLFAVTAQAGDKPIKLFPNAPLKTWVDYYGSPNKDGNWIINDRLELSVDFRNGGNIQLANVDGKPALTEEEAAQVMATIGLTKTWTWKGKDTNWGDPTTGLSANYTNDDGLLVLIEKNTILTTNDNSPDVVIAKVKELAPLMHWSNNPDTGKAGIEDGTFYADLLATVGRSKHERGFGPKIAEWVISNNPRFHGLPEFNSEGNFNSEERPSYDLAFTLAEQEEAKAKNLYNAREQK